MFKLSNIRVEDSEGWTKLICDFSAVNCTNPFSEKTMWIAVEEKNKDMISDKVYDPFVLVITILGMYFHQDVVIEGNVSARLYHNLTHYLLKIFDNYSDYTVPININVQGFDTVAEHPGKLIGTGISCGVDSLTTIYDNFIEEKDENFKINSLFFVNCGTHGDFENPKTRKLWLDRVSLNKPAADELGLPMYIIDSNLHAYTHRVGEQKIGYLAIYSCILACQKYIRRYLASGNLSYDEIANNCKNSRDFDISEYCESYMPNLISTECFELVIDGCQYTRPEKIERIVDWDISHKYLNVCAHPINKGHNCSKCNKCMWTLITLDSINALDKYKGVFNLDVYRRNALKWERRFVAHQGKDAMETSIVEYAKSHNLALPNIVISKCITSLETFIARVNRKLQKNNREINNFPKKW